MDEKLVITAKKYKGDTAVVSLRLPTDLIKKIDEVGEKTGRTRNEIIAMSIDFALDNLVVEEN